MQNKTAFGTIVAASAAGLLLGASPASAQTAADFVPDCASGVLAYSPGLTAGSASDAAPTAGQTIVLNSGEGSFDPGTVVTATFNGTTLSGVTVSPTGNASVSLAIPQADVGTFVVVFTGTLKGADNVVGVCFTSAAALAGNDGGPDVQPSVAPVVQPISGTPEAPSVRPSALPFTGSVELLTVAGLGAALLTVGAGTVVLARRRRQDDVAAV